MKSIKTEILIKYLEQKAKQFRKWEAEEVNEAIRETDIEAKKEHYLRSSLNCSAANTIENIINDILLHETFNVKWN